MLRPSRNLQDPVIVARADSTEDAIGVVKDRLLDDAAWAVEMEVAVFKHHGRAGDWPGALSAEAAASERVVTSRAV